MNPNRETITQEIARGEARLSQLDNERLALTNHLQQLHEQLRTTDSPANHSESNSALSPTEKISLFRSLFRGREDVFPKLWTSRSGGKGYAPACSNDLVSGRCGKGRKPRVPCSECGFQNYIPMSDQVIRDHLQGKHVIGAYSLLPDDTCWFLAADFDKSTWQEDIAALRNTCHSLEIPVAIERSRSGNGAHAWFFFTEPVSAASARAMGCYLITETMSRRHQLSMDSYDRLFPSQDTMPRGGFGNLIALPLQKDPREQGNSVFIDENFVPYSDQWGYLSAQKRMTPFEVSAVTDKALRQGQVIGLRMPSDGEEDQAPWDRTPSRRAPQQQIMGKLPKKVAVILAQSIFVAKRGLPSVLLNSIKRLAAFQNPEFFKKQKMRLSTNRTPRIISCFEELPDHIALPRGCFDALQELLGEHKIALKVEDKRQNGLPTTFSFQGMLSEIQQQAIEQIVQHDIGIFVAPPGSGKTVVGTYLVSERKCSTLILVHRKPLLDQWVAQLAHFLNLPPKSVGTIGAGKSKANSILDVAMIQSLVRNNEVSDLIAGYGQIIVDECHHLPSVSFERVSAEAKARYVVGLTATPYRRDGHQAIIHFQCGPTRFNLSRKQEANSDTFIRSLIVRETGFSLQAEESGISIQDLYARLASNRQRNMFILDDIRRSLKQGRSPLLLTERKEHLDYFVENLRGDVRNLIVLQGGIGAKQRREIMAKLASIPDDEERLILATGRYIGEGFDDARLDTLFLALPFSWKGNLIQYAGRLHRTHSQKSEVQVYDYVDSNVPMLVKMHAKRLSGFKAMGYERGNYE
jgi:superfamily II DNA or RNA helicase